MTIKRMGKIIKEIQIPEIVLHRSAGCLLHAWLAYSLTSKLEAIRSSEMSADFH
jgi:hypothetical protein